MLTLLLVLAISCKSKQSNKKEVVVASQTKKNTYELANEFLASLKGNKSDTIIFHKRTFINCCDFFTFFWGSNGKYFLKKNSCR